MLNFVVSFILVTGVQKPPKFRYCHCIAVYSVCSILVGLLDAAQATRTPPKRLVSGLYHIQAKVNLSFILQLHTYIFSYLSSSLSLIPRLSISHIKPKSIFLSSCIYHLQIYLFAYLIFIQQPEQFQIIRKMLKTLSKKGIFLQRLKALALPI